MEIKFRLVILVICITTLLSACNHDDDILISYNGEGSTETILNIAIQIYEQPIYIGKVKIIDDDPSLDKVLSAILENDESLISVALDEENGNIVEINGYRSDNDDSNWILLVNNIAVEYQYNQVAFFNDDCITLIYE